jgi:hypothetical protein
MKVASLWPRNRHVTGDDPSGSFWDDELGNLVIDEDGTYMELL